MTHKIQMEAIIRRYKQKITVFFLIIFTFTFVVTLFYKLLPVLAGTRSQPESDVCASLNWYCCSVVEVQAPAKRRNEPTSVLQSKGAVSYKLMLHKITKEG